MAKVKHPHIDKVEGRSKPYRVRYYDKTGKRVSAFYASEEEAATAAEEIENTQVLPLEMAVSNAERIALYRLRAIGAERSISAEKLLELAIQAAKDYRPKAGKPLSEAKDEFIADCKRRKLRHLSVVFYKRHLKRFLSNMGALHCDAITRAHVKGYLDKESSGIQAKRALSAFFSWCAEVGREYVEISPLYGLRLSFTRRDAKGVPVLSPEHTKTIMGAVPDAMKAGFALMAFAGVRPMELVVDKKKKDVLTWECVDFTRRVISIPGSVAKTREPRPLHGLPENLWAWLSLTPLEKRTGRVMPCAISYFYDVRREARTKDGKELFKMPTDVLRHSFASYGYHFLGAERAVEICGHDFAVFKKHYKAAASAADSQKYFAIMPKNLQKESKNNLTV